MQERANKFIEILESEDLLSPDILDELRKQVRESKTKLKPELLAKLLVDNGHLTKFQATKLIAGMSDAPSAAEAPPTAGATAPANSNDDLGFADPDSEFVEVAEEVTEVAAVETVPVVESVEAVESVEVIQAVESVQAVETVAAVETVEAVTAVEDQSSLGSSSDSVFDSKSAPTKVVRPQSPDNPWDSMRILGRGVALGLVLIIGVALVWIFVRGNAEDTLTRAETAYEQRSYETAAEIYLTFSKKWPTHEQASFAKVRSSLATIRKDSEGAPDPVIGLNTAMEELPKIAEEAGLGDQRDDLTDVLVSLATSFIKRADSRKTTDERKEVMGEFTKLMGLINDPKFVGQAQKEAQRVTLKTIIESEKRINYDIGRDEELATTLGEIDALLDAENTPDAFAKRDELTQKYPLLETNEQLRERILKACEIQRGQVADSSLVPTSSKNDPEPQFGKSFILGNTAGRAATDLRGQTIFIRVKGSVFALNGETGNILWQRYVGRGFNSDPIRLGEGGNADALICVPAKGHILRVDGKTGDLKWFVDFETRIHSPIRESEDLFVASYDGDIVSLDLNSGSVLWSKKIPQQLTTGPGLAFGKDTLYLPANHTSMYLLSRTSGECKQVRYLGHRDNSIVVPPVLIRGRQLFVFENSDANGAKIRLFSTSEAEGRLGLDLDESQAPISIEGNIVVPALEAPTRVIVQSDLGQILALAVEILEDDSLAVSTVADRAKNVLQPQMSWLAAERNNLWITDTRLTSLNLQVTMGQFRSNWSRYDGDNFTGPPVAFRDTIVYARTQRGNRGVRIAAADGESGKEIWTTDIGIPVTLLSQESGKRTAINTSAMLYSLPAPGVVSKATITGAKDRNSLNFNMAAKLSNGVAVLFNESRSEQMAVLSDGKLEMVNATFQGATLSTQPIAVGENVAVALDNGQFVLLNPVTGLTASSAYSLPMSKEKIKWNKPLYVESAKVIYVANNKRKLVRLSAGESLRALTEVDLEAPLVGPIVALGKNIAAVSSRKSGDSLGIYNATSLKSSGTLKLKGRLLAGPFALPSGLLLQTNAGLQLISQDGKSAWAIDFPNSAIVGEPTEMNGKVLVATVGGQVWNLSASDGSVVGNLDAGQALSSAPLVISPGGLLIGSDEGSVLAIPMPQSPTIK
ncbi:MAG: PQQ-binding-like beta-propeller repeat protein [Planctomycetota bacterium]